MGKADARARAEGAGLGLGREYRAYAKINLALEVLGRRADGYHEVRSVLQAVAWHDSLFAEPAPELSFSVEGEEGAVLTELATADNLVLKAARALQSQARIARGASLRLHKRIPVAAGLGGGSSDAAATLWALNDLWGLRWTLEKLAALAATLGADVPFFLTSGAALVSGRGEKVEPLPTLAALPVLLVVPRINLPSKTRWAYSLLAPYLWSSGAMTLDLAAQLRAHQVDLAGRHWRNAFEPVIASHLASVQRCRQAMWRAGVKGVNLSGAGPTLFALLANEAEAAASASHLQKELHEEANVLLTSTVGPPASPIVEPPGSLGQPARWHHYAQPGDTPRARATECG